MATTQPTPNILRGLPSAPTADGTANQIIRADQYAQQVVTFANTPLMQLAQDGRVFVAMETTIGTSLTHALVTAPGITTAALFTHKNNNPTGGNYVFPWSLKLRNTAATATATSMDFFFVLDPGARTPTANNVALTASNVNPASGRATQSAIQWATGGTMTVPAAVAPINVARAQFTMGIPAANEQYCIQFGQLDNAGLKGGAVIRSVDPGFNTAGAAPIAIPPGYTLVAYRWGTSPNEATNAPSFTIEYTYIE